MSSPAVLALPSLPVGAATRRMLETGVRRMPVEDEFGRLVGVVSRHDLLRAHGRKARVTGTSDPAPTTRKGRS